MLAAVQIVAREQGGVRHRESEAEEAERLTDSAHLAISDSEVREFVIPLQQSRDVYGALISQVIPTQI